MYEVRPERGGLVHDLELRLDVGVVDRAGDRAQLALGELVRERREIALLVADAETDAGHGEPRFSTGKLNARSVYLNRSRARNIGVWPARCGPDPQREGQTRNVRA